MSSRSSSKSSSTFIPTPATSTSRSPSTSYSYPISTPPRRYSTQLTHLPPTTDIDAKHSQKADLQSQIRPQPQSRLAALSSHGLPRPPAPGHAQQRERTRTRAPSVSFSSPKMEAPETTRSQSRPGTTCGLGQTHSLRTNCHDDRVYDRHNHHPHHQGHLEDGQDATAVYGEEERRRETGDQAANGAAGSPSKLKQLRSKVAGWRQRERERRREAREDSVEMGGGGHWTEY